VKRPEFGQGYPPLEPKYARDKPCRQGDHLAADEGQGWKRCTECGYFIDDLCPVPGCREITRGGLCDVHEFYVQPEARA
jgi:hypothetical protein